MSDTPALRISVDRHSPMPLYYQVSVQLEQAIESGDLLVRKAGVGTQVVPGRVRREVELTSLYDDLASSAQRPRTTVLRNEVVAPVAVAAEMGVEPGPRCCTWSAPPGRR